MFATRRRSARAFACALLVGALAVLVPSTASASAPGDVCSAFPHTQTYVDGGLFRAPAWHYGGPVTVVYEAEECTSRDRRPHDFALAVEGTATIYEGLGLRGTVLDVKPFTSYLSYEAGDGRAEWPIRWWTCEEAEFTYVWTIEDVYRFAMTADDGEWRMGQRDLESGRSSRISTDACSDR